VTPEEQWDVTIVNFIVKLPESHGHDTIMNIVDSVSKQVHFILAHTMINAEDAAQLYLQEVWKHHGLPSVKATLMVLINNFSLKI
jgi:hypothetical protein